MRVHGVGPKTAKDWYNRGIRSVEEAQQTLLRDGDGWDAGDDEEDDGEHSSSEDRPKQLSYC